jgi:DNA invertase Pin-like site-specific DNA recombinase
MTRVRPYYRQSKEDRQHRTHSIPIQREAFEASLAVRKNGDWTWDGVEYVDEGEHGWNLDRPSLRRAVQDARDGKYDILVVPWRQDRLSRDPEDIKHLIRTLVSLGVGVFVNGKLLDSRDAYKSERLMVGILAEVSAEELSKLHDATSRGIGRAKAAGKRVGKAPIGFKYTGNGDGKLVLDDLGERGMTMLSMNFNDISRELGIPRTRAWRLKRNLIAFNEGNLDEVLWKGSEGSRAKTEAIKAEEQASRSRFKRWLVEMAPEAEFEWT